MGFGEMWVPGSPHRHTVFAFAAGHGTTMQTDGIDTRTIKTLDIDFAVYRYRNVTERSLRRHDRVHAMTR